jgi:predicted Zn finger-like uncharacterized protein
MKFLCDNCKAKYQIADEKIAGRTLRMKCRRCEHDIVIRGKRSAQASQSTGQASQSSAQASGSAPATSSKARPQPGTGSSQQVQGAGQTAPQGQDARTSSVSRKPEGLGADFRRQVATGSEQHDGQGSAPSTLDQWHVAIRDVPVGPVRRDELARKIGTGAVTRDSLVWREGFDDWRPLRDVPELVPLLRQDKPQAPPPPPRPMSKSARGSGRDSSASASRGRTAQQASTSSREESSRPAAQGNVIPIGGRMGAGAAPAVDQEQPSPEFGEEEEATRVTEGLPPELAEPEQGSGQSAAQARGEPTGDATDRDMSESAGPAAAGAASLEQDLEDLQQQYAPARRRRRPPPVGLIFLGLGTVVFAGVFGAVAALEMFGGDSQNTQKVASKTPEQPSEPAAGSEPGQAEFEFEEPTKDHADEESEQESTQEQEGESASGSKEQKAQPKGKDDDSASKARRRARRRAARRKKDKGSDLTEEERKRLERFADKSGSTAGNLQVPGSGSSSDRGGGESLSAKQLSPVISENRSDLQRCYENAIRGMSSPPKVRMDVQITVGRSGTVTRVNVTGSDVGDLRRCIERGVKRWRFPQAGKVTRTSFPVVFQPGS